MHAVLMTLTIDPAQAPAAAAALTDTVMPALRSAPGFLTGYWLEPVGGSGFSMLVFETEEQAREAVDPGTGLWAAPGVTIISTEYRRVAATLP